ncbi:hypothetical protein N431DRAFT_495543 [Stipitochalara longipes BDJ]|nr:hypothetical protein N431DRAFT_495543 [Stipitochalara longipes BDJ]
MPDSTPNTRKVRRSNPKARTGCKTCKIRRVKCDEGKPTCERCRKFGVKCDGYGTELSNKRSTPHPIVPNLKPDFQPILWEPASTLFKSEKDYRYFQSFCEKTALQLDGFVPTDLWSRLMLQACERSQAVRYGIVAIAALDLTSDASLSRLQTSHLASDSLDPNAHHQFALQQYGLAVRHMRNSLSKGDQDLPTILMTCLVIICFEAFHGNHESAFSQLDIGLKMIEQAAKTDTTSTRLEDGLSSSLLSSIDNELIRAFIRLDTQSLFIQSEETAFRKSFVLVDLTGMPTRFRNFKEAGHYRDLIHMQWMHFINLVLKEGENFSCLQNLNTLGSQYPSPTLEEEGAYYLSISQRWQDAFSPLLRDGQSSPGKPNFLAAKTLELHSLSVRFICESVPIQGTSKKKDSKESMPIFRKMVSLAKIILGDSINKHSQGVFTFVPQVIVPLYVVGYSCPHSPTRREAIRLLVSTKRREGLWDATMAGKIVEWVMHVEEEFLEGDYVAEEMRMVKLTMKYDLMGRTASVAGLMPHKGSAGFRVVEADLKW